MNDLKMNSNKGLVLLSCHLVHYTTPVIVRDSVLSGKGLPNRFHHCLHSNQGLS